MASLQDVIQPRPQMRVHAEVCHDNGIASVHYSPQGYCLYTGGEKGEIGMFDLRMMRMVEVSLRPNCPPQRRLGAEILALRVRHSKRTSRRCSPSAFRRISATSTRARKTARSRCDRASAFHCSAGSDHLPTCQVWEPGSFETAVVEVKDAHVRHTGARATPCAKEMPWVL